MMETCSLSTKTNIDSETSQKEMKLILKKIPSDLITFEDIINKRIKLMQNSAEEYDKFLKLLDDLITRIDLTMDKKKSLFCRTQQSLLDSPSRILSPKSFDQSIPRPI